MSTAEDRPAFIGLVVYRNLEYRYSFLYPQGWHQAELASEGGQGVVVSPAPDDAATSFSVEVRDLGVAVGADDLPALRRGFLVGLRRLRAAAIEQQDEYAVGALVGLEARHTFRDGRARRKRWVRLLYQGTLQARLIAQGATVEQFDYWLPMFTPAMSSFQFGDWWAAAIGQAWRPSLDAAAPDQEGDAGEQRDTGNRTPIPG